MVDKVKKRGLVERDFVSPEQHLLFPYCLLLSFSVPAIQMYVHVYSPLQFFTEFYVGKNITLNRLMQL